MINYAHRGASEYSPENTLSSFYLGLIQGANGIETDVRRTKDGELVLFHDSKLSRVTDGDGLLAEHTLAELKKLRVYGNSTNTFYDRIPTYREFLEHFASYDIRFAIELKAEDIEADVLRLSKEFGILEKTTFTSSHFDYLKKLKA
ncbi:MAG: glycerophosphodiester phosphodiesterase [Clostridia bacterium]|nr:glycerophosphodiester phosphodiesterase [Clostridia bacterium]